jgi:antitoxin FitA
MFDSQPGKIAIRNVPADVLRALTDLAGQRDRSVEGEARHALRAWVEPQLRSDARSSRAAVIGQRLRHLLDELSAQGPGLPVAPSRIAEALGWTHAEALESWVSGESEPSFSELRAVAEVVGCSADWLAHGEGQPFPSQYARIPEDSDAGAKWLLQPVAEGGPRPSDVLLIRSDTKEGELAIVKRFSAWKAQVYRTPYHVSEVIGAGGETSLAWLTLVLERLSKRWTRDSTLTVESYLLGEDVFRALLEGKRHPFNVLRSSRAVATCWWEDIWDETQYSKQQEYWPGWRSLTERIARVVDGRAIMKEQRDKMRGLKAP